jgi:hypothetical protein
VKIETPIMQAYTLQVAAAGYKCTEKKHFVSHLLRVIPLRSWLKKYGEISEFAALFYPVSVRLWAHGVHASCFYFNGIKHQTG